MSEDQRYIAISYRNKRTVDEEERPSLCAIQSGGRIKVYKFATETDERDFKDGIFPTKFRDAAENDELALFHRWQIKWREVKADEDRDNLPQNLLSKDKKNSKRWLLAEKVPCKFEGLKPGDTVAMILGGSADRFAYAVANKFDKIGGRLMRIKPSTIKERRGNGKKDDDHLLLLHLIQEEPELFQLITRRDRDAILIREKYMQRMTAQKERMKCEGRLRSRFIGQTFLSDEGGYPEGAIEDLFDEAKANDVILQNLVAEEEARHKELEKAVNSLDVYTEVFKHFKGCGPRIAGALMAVIGDIRRFPSASKLKAYCCLFPQFKDENGVWRKLKPGEKPMAESRHPRRRKGEMLSIQPDAKEALYQLADQFVRQSDKTEWGRALLAEKAKKQAQHPEPLCQVCGTPFTKDCEAAGHKRKYHKAHIAEMAKWPVLAAFMEKLYKEWYRFVDQKDGGTHVEDEPTTVADEHAA